MPLENLESRFAKERTRGAGLEQNVEAAKNQA
jgi:hypothetical protein